MIPFKKHALKHLTTHELGASSRCPAGFFHSQLGDLSLERDQTLLQQKNSPGEDPLVQQRRAVELLPQVLLPRIFLLVNAVTWNTVQTQCE